MAKGYIKVEVFLGKEVLPIENCKITIRKFDDSNMSFEKVLYTDANGRCETISVEAPDIKYSKVAQNEVVPYSTYSIIAEADGFIDTIINGVQVFPSVTAIQKIEMFMQSKDKIFVSKNIINIPVHQLISNEPRMDKISEKLPQYNLATATIPKYINIHLGPPNVYAKTVSQTFPEYIKTVVSSEIYPTWPNSALRSNIYAQISFALNRLYTKWYTSRGYSFDITNSINYDQNFNYGRNIYDNISELVDEIFNQYLCKVGFLEPFLANLCTGISFACDGLSKWGAVDLSKRGYDAFSILQYYYGYDISLTIADRIESSPLEYPGTALRLNSVGEDVKLIQKELNIISDNYSAIPKISSTNGTFDKETENAVKAFQTLFDLTPDGIIGPTTWHRIMYVYLATVDFNQLELKPEIDSLGNYYYPPYVLTLGSTGEDVRLLQYYLNIISRFYDVIPKVDITGVYDEKLRRSVIEFQKLFNISVDGLVGRETWTKIYQVFNEIEDNLLGGLKDLQFPVSGLQLGATGPWVTRLQYHLAVISYFYNEVRETPIDGIYGEKTRDAILDFQKLFNLKETGDVNLETWLKIREIFNDLKPKIQV